MLPQETDHSLIEEAQARLGEQAKRRKEEQEARRICDLLRQDCVLLLKHWGSRRKNTPERVGYGLLAVVTLGMATVPPAIIRRLTLFQLADNMVFSTSVDGVGQPVEVKVRSATAVPAQSEWIGIQMKGLSTHIVLGRGWSMLRETHFDLDSESGRWYSGCKSVPLSIALGYQGLMETIKQQHPIIPDAPPY